MRSNPAHILRIFALSVVVPAACGDPTAVPRTHVQLGVGALTNPNADDELLSLNASIPGFGGYAVSPEGRVHLYLRDLSQSEAAKSVLRSFLSDQVFFRRPGVVVNLDDIEVRQGQFDIAELLGWRQQLSNALRSRHVSDLDEANNVLWYGVENEASISGVMSVAAGLGIPASAIRVGLFHGEPTATIRDAFTPVPGGVQIYTRGIPETCTLGFNVRVGMSTTTQMLTASHCTSAPNYLDSDTVFQPDTTRPAGNEYSDLVGFTSSTDPNCPTGEQCRYSDAAIIDYAYGVAADYGYIARPATGGSLTLDAVYPYYTLIGRTLGSHLYNYVSKVGRTTGLTTGQVTATCVHGAFWAGIYFLCQNVYTAVSGPGDSGGPVFGVSGATSATALGITWFRGVYNGDSVSVYSPISGIHEDFGIVLRVNP